MGRGVERTHCNVAGGSREVADCGTNGTGSATASRPRGSTLAHRKTGRNDGGAK